MTGHTDAPLNLEEVFYLGGTNLIIQYFYKWSADSSRRFWNR